MTQKQLSACSQCRHGRLHRVSVDHVVEGAGHKFSFRDVPALRCDSCAEVQFFGVVLEKMHLFAADELARSGARSGAAVRFMRKALGLSAQALADLLAVAPETVSRWENDKQEIDPRALGLIGALVSDSIEGKTRIAELLGAVKKPATLSKTVQMRLLPSLG